MYRGSTVSHIRGANCVNNSHHSRANHFNGISKPILDSCLV